MTWVLGFFQANLLRLLSVVAAIGAVVATLFFVYSMGQKQAKTSEQLRLRERELRNVRTRLEVEAEVGGLDDDALDDELRPPARRRKRM